MKGVADDPCFRGPADVAQAPAVAPKPEGAIRFATFNASLNRAKPRGLIADLAKPDNVQAANVAEILQRVRPDILLINEFDYDRSPIGDAQLGAGYPVASLEFQFNYLKIPHNGAEAIEFEYYYQPSVNTGVPSGADLDNNGKAVITPGSPGYGDDAFGYGMFPGQYGMIIYSKYPIASEDIREFKMILWKDMPKALLPTKPDGSPWYSPEALEGSAALIQEPLGHPYQSRRQSHPPARESSDTAGIRRPRASQRQAQPR